MSDKQAILIVEDDEWWQGVLKEPLADEGYPVTILADYQDVRQALEEQTFGLVILDLQLTKSAPVFDGERLLAHISRHYSSTPCIVVSGHGDIRVVRDAFAEYHVVDFIAKPDFDIPTFIELVGTVLMSVTDPAMLRRILDEKFDQEEIQNLCFDLSIDFGNLPGEGKKSREVVAYFQRRDRLKELSACIARLRPGSL